MSGENVPFQGSKLTSSCSNRMTKMKKRSRWSKTIRFVRPSCFSQLWKSTVWREVWWSVDCSTGGRILCLFLFHHGSKMHFGDICCVTCGRFWRVDLIAQVQPISTKRQFAPIWSWSTTRWKLKHRHSCWYGISNLASMYYCALCLKRRERAPKPTMSSH